MVQKKTQGVSYMTDERSQDRATGGSVKRFLGEVDLQNPTERALLFPLPSLRAFLTKPVVRARL